MGTEAKLALVEKTRAHGRMTSGELVGDVAGRTALIVDDIVASGGTLAAAAQACRQRGCSQVVAVVAHGLFVPPAETILAGSAIDRILVTDSVPPFRLSPQRVRDKVEIVSVAPLLGEAVRRMHAGEPLSELLEIR
jgi:ribose-phosphate pyrophosphokinase